MIEVPFIVLFFRCVDRAIVLCFDGCLGDTGWLIDLGGSRTMDNSDVRSQRIRTHPTSADHQIDSNQPNFYLLTSIPDFRLRNL